MAITFRKNLQSLVDDIARGGYTIHSVEQTTDARGRDVEIRLANGVIVNWDPQTHSIWTEGPQKAAERIEAFLRRLYEGGRFHRTWALNPLLMVGGVAIAIVVWLFYMGALLGSR